MLATESRVVNCWLDLLTSFVLNLIEASLGDPRVPRKQIAKGE
jgi:hypothetical protein